MFDWLFKWFVTLPPRAADGEIRHAADSLRAPIAKALAEEEERKRQLEEEKRKRLQKELEEMRRREKEEERRRSEAGSSGSKDDGVRFSISGIKPYESLSRDRQAAQPQKKGTRQGAGAGSREASLPESAFDGDEGMAKTIAAQLAAQQEREPAKSVSSALLHLVATKCAGIAPIAYKRAGISRQVYSRIISARCAKVEKLTVMRLCIGLQLSWEESVAFLKSAGYAFSDSLPMDIIFAFCIKRGLFNIIDVNSIIVSSGLKPFEIIL